VFADSTFPVVIDGKPLIYPGLLIDGLTYVPLSVVSERLGAKVNWDGTQATVRTISEPMISPATKDPSHVSKVEAALKLLKEKDPADYELVCRHVIFININEDETNKLLGETLLYNDVFNRELMANGILLTSTLLNKNDTILTASVIVHETTHLCNVSNKDIYNNRKADENIAFLRSITTLRILGAPQQLIDHTEYTRKQITK